MKLRVIKKHRHKAEAWAKGIRKYSKGVHDRWTIEATDPLIQEVHALKRALQKVHEQMARRAVMEVHSA